MGVNKIDGCPCSDDCIRARYCLGSGQKFYKNGGRTICPDGREDELETQDSGDPDGVRGRHDPNSPERQISTE